MPNFENQNQVGQRPRGPSAGPGAGRGPSAFGAACRQRLKKDLEEGKALPFLSRSPEPPKRSRGSR